MSNIVKFPTPKNRGWFKVIADIVNKDGSVVRTTLSTHEEQEEAEYAIQELATVKRVRNAFIVPDSNPLQADSKLWPIPA